VKADNPSAFLFFRFPLKDRAFHQLIQEMLSSQIADELQLVAHPVGTGGSSAFWYQPLTILSLMSFSYIKTSERSIGFRSRRYRKESDMTFCCSEGEAFLLRSASFPLIAQL
jgi:hypothetical protein